MDIKSGKSHLCLVLVISYQVISECYDYKISLTKKGGKNYFFVKYTKEAFRLLHSNGLYILNSALLKIFIFQINEFKNEK